MAPLSREDIELWRLYTQRPSAFVARRMGPRKEGLRSSLDLHGMTLQEAWKAVRSFIESHRDAGTRTVTIICGKGGQIARELPIWCEQIPCVRSASPILDSMGEHGAFRISFRRQKRAPSSTGKD